MTDTDRASEVGAVLYRPLGQGEEVMVVPQIYNAAIRRGRYLDCGWNEQW